MDQMNMDASTREDLDVLLHDMIDLLVTTIETTTQNLPSLLLEVTRFCVKHKKFLGYAIRLYPVFKVVLRKYLDGGFKGLKQVFIDCLNTIWGVSSVEGVVMMLKFFSEQPRMLNDPEVEALVCFLDNLDTQLPADGMRLSSHSHFLPYSELRKSIEYLIKIKKAAKNRRSESWRLFNGWVDILLSTLWLTSRDEIERILRNIGGSFVKEVLTLIRKANICVTMRVTGKGRSKSEDRYHQSSTSSTARQRRSRTEDRYHQSSTSSTAPQSLRDSTRRPDQSSTSSTARQSLRDSTRRPDQSSTSSTARQRRRDSNGRPDQSSTLSTDDERRRDSNGRPDQSSTLSTDDESVTEVDRSLNQRPFTEDFFNTVAYAVGILWVWRQVLRVFNFVRSWIRRN